MRSGGELPDVKRWFAGAGLALGRMASGCIAGFILGVRRKRAQQRLGSGQTIVASIACPYGVRSNGVETG